MSDARLLGGRYELGDLLGRGGMAQVRRARDTRLEREVAVKQLRVDLASDSTFQARFRREARAAAGLSHPNIVAVYDTGEQIDPNTGVSIPYIVMELVEGHTLRDILRDGRKILPTRAFEFTQGVLAALASSHDMGIVHRDIKPANVMLTPRGQVKVMDFGIARAVADTSGTMTQTAAVIGTAQYLSPEQARGERVDARSDIYAAGCLLYELLVGRPPFQGESPVSVAYQHVREVPQAPSEIDPEITPDMDAVVLKALAKRPADRYQTAQQMNNDIARLLEGRQVTAVLPQPPAPAPAGPRRASPTSVLPKEPARAMPAARAAEEEPVEKRKMSGATITLITLLSLLVVIIGIGIAMLLWPKEPPAPTTVSVPRVLELSEADAVATLEKVDLAAKVERTSGPVETKGQVIKQDPLPETSVDLKSVVTITVNTGPETAQIPANLIGQPVDDVVSKLKQLKFTKIKREDASPDTEPVRAKPGEVVAVAPAAGKDLPLDTEIVITVATGKTPVPNLNGLTLDDARELAGKFGFSLEAHYEDSTNPPGKIFKQDPKVGTIELRSTPIIVKVAQTPPTPPPAPPPTTPTTGPSNSTTPDPPEDNP